MEEQSYEQQMRRLEEIVEKLEDGSLSLDDSLKLFEEGTKLAASCNKVLNDAEQKIVSLSGEEAK